MTDTGSTGDRRTKNQRREDAREKAKALREQHRKKERRNRFLLQGGIIVVVLAVIAGISLLVVNSFRPPGPGPANMASDGITITKGLTAVSTPGLEPNQTPSVPAPDPSVIDIQVYLDYLCPYCGDFDKTNTEQMTQWINTGAANVTFHPVAILTSQSAGTQYSLRAANAAACVANYSPSNFYAFNTAMFEKEPQEGTPGLNNDEIKAIIAAAGASSLTEINQCVDSKMFNSFVKGATERALAGPIPNSSLPKITGTPTVLVNGKQYTGPLDNAQAFSTFVLSADSSSTPATPPPAG